MRNLEDPAIGDIQYRGIPSRYDRKEYICPICEDECSTVYTNFWGDAVGCNNCIGTVDAPDFFEEDDE